MYKSFRQFLGFFKASFKVQLKSITAIFFGFILPIVFVISFGFFSQETGSYKVGVVENSDPEYSNYIEQISSQDFLQVEKGKRSNLEKQTKQGDLDAYIYLDSQNTIKVITNLNRSANGSSAVSLLENLADKITLQKNQIETSFTFSQEQIQGRTGNYIDFLLPGIIGFSLLSTATSGTAFSFLSLKQTQALKRIFASPAKTQPFILGHSLSRLVISLIQNIFLILVAVLLVDFSINNGFIGLLQLSLLISIGLAVFLGFGYIVAGISGNSDQASAISNLVVLPQFLMAGTFFDVNQLPQWLENIATLLPLYYFNEAMRLVSLDGRFIWSPSVLEHLLGLLVWGLILYAISFRVFNLKSK